LDKKGIVQPNIEYRKIPDYDGYLAGSDGNIYNDKLYKLKSYLTSTGWVVQLKQNNKSHHDKVHLYRIMSSLFLGPQPEGYMVCYGAKGNSDHSINNLSYQPYRYNNDTTTLYKIIPGFSDYYAGDDGNIYSNKFNKQTKMKSHLQPKQGYLHVGLSNNGKIHNYRIHVLIAMAFLGPKPEGKIVCHGPNGQLDNSPHNLRYGTYIENRHDTIRDDTDDRGEKSANSKLKNEDIRIIWCLKKHLKHKEIAELYGVSVGTINDIFKLKTWKHLTVDIIKGHNKKNGITI